ncbi:MAG: hypothetical protein A370_02962 [Clostridium sp. Maddingley MBC34-26]|nr:MAG: hypothetical protein A370_02962 [Clostridium sp. Maddingley MBC34-26]
MNILYNYSNYYKRKTSKNYAIFVIILQDNPQYLLFIPNISYNKNNTCIVWNLYYNKIVQNIYIVLFKTKEKTI